MKGLFFLKFRLFKKDKQTNHCMSLLGLPEQNTTDGVAKPTKFSFSSGEV